MMDLHVARARITGYDGVQEIGVKKGKIAKIGRNVERGAKEIDAAGNIVLPTFVEPHIHLDKVLLGEKLKEASSIAEAREAVREAKRRFTVGEVRERVERVLPRALANGVTAIRTHVDVDGIVKLTAVKALLEIRKKYRGVLDLQIVAFPQEGVLQDSDVPELLRSAVGMGAEVVGGMPEAEANVDESKRQLDLLVELAEESGVPLDVHCDVLPFARNAEYYASKVIAHRLQGRATADHLIALSYYDDYYASRVISLIKRASMNVVVNPCTMMTSGTLDPPPKSRGVTRIKELVKAGINTAYGIDNMVDPYNPFGDFEPLTNAWLLAYQGQLNTLSEMEELLRMPTQNSARILALGGYGLVPGCNADFNVLSERSARDILRTHRIPRYVVKRGRVFAENEFRSKHSYRMP